MGAVSVINIHLQRLQEKYPGASVHPLGNGTTLVIVPGVTLPAGWNRGTTTAYFLAPVGYPMAQPDCFWVDGELRLQNGGMPKNSGQQALPSTGQPALWFSWHPNGWNANKDDFRAYSKIIQDRLSRPE
jgi:hypothetical protein